MKTLYRALASAVLLASLSLAVACAPKASAAGADVGVFVPGVASGSPIYEMLVEGAKRAVASVPGATLTVVEAGYNQAEWLDKLGAMAATGKFELIVSSNPAMPELCAAVAERFPSVRFFVADAWLAGNPAIHTVLYNQLEQGYLVGVLAGLATLGEMKGMNADKKVGLLVAQSYPTLDKLIAPGFSAGLAAVDPAIVLETRTIGNWYDAAKAEELARGLFESGVDVILPIAGGAGQGALSAAKEAGRYAVWFDGPSGYTLGPESVIGCATIAQDRLVEERVKALLGKSSKLFGTAEALGFKDGYVGFDSSGPGFAALPESVRTRFAAAKADLESGRVAFPITSF